MLNVIKKKYTNFVSDKKFSEILSGSVWALAAQVVAIGLGLLASILIARRYGAGVLGVVAVINSFLMFTSLITVLGTDTSILRLIPEHLIKFSPTSAYRIFRKTQYLVMAASIITGSLSFFLAKRIATIMFNKPHLSYYFALASTFIMFRSLMQLNSQGIRGLKLIQGFALIQIMPHLLNLLILIFLGYFTSSKDCPVYAQLGAYALTGVLGFSIIELAFKKIIAPIDTLHRVSVKDIISISLPMLMTSTMSFLVAQTGIIMLGIFRSDTEVGLYSTAAKLATLTSFLLNAINSIAAPKFSELFHSNKLDELFHVAQKSAKLIFYITTPILLMFAVFGKAILVRLYGQDFIVAYPPLLILVIGQFINAISGSTGFFMNMTGKEKELKNIMLLSAIINISLNYVLIPMHGILGAAIAGMVSLSIWNICILIYIKRVFGKTTGYLPNFAWR